MREMSLGGFAISAVIILGFAGVVRLGIAIHRRTWELHRRIQRLERHLNGENGGAPIASAWDTQTR